MLLRLAALLLVPVWIVAAIWLAATGECGAGASCVASVRVEGRQYAISVARSALITDDDLTSYAAAERMRTGTATIDDQTYRLGAVDPTKVLVMKLAPGQADDAGPIGRYLLLVSDPSGWALTCPYFAPNDPLSGCE